MSRKLIWGFIAILVVIGGYFYASPYLVLNSIKNAAQAGDSEKVSAYIDYPSVRQSFKDQVNAYVVKDMASKETNGWEALGAMMASAMVDKMVDALVTPEGMTMILKGKDFKESLEPIEQQSKPEVEETGKKAEFSTRYLSFNIFEAKLKNTENEEELKIILERNGLSWKVKKFVLPLNNKSHKTESAEPVQAQEIEEPVKIVETEPKSVFNHSGVEPGKIMEFCYRDPCSVAKVQDFQILSKTAKDVDVELTLLGGSKGWEQTETEWSDSTHKIQITCSIEKPTVRMDGQVTVVPLNRDLGVPGVLMTDAEMYLNTCHGDFNGTIEEATIKYGYDVADAT